jgi:hypothetical protein
VSCVLPGANQRTIPTNSGGRTSHRERLRTRRADELDLAPMMNRCAGPAPLRAVMSNRGAAVGTRRGIRAERGPVAGFGAVDTFARSVSGRDLCEGLAALKAGAGLGQRSGLVGAVHRAKTLSLRGVGADLIRVPAVGARLFHHTTDLSSHHQPPARAYQIITARVSNYNRHATCVDANG